MRVFLPFFSKSLIKIIATALQMWFHNSGVSLKKFYASHLYCSRIDYFSNEKMGPGDTWQVNSSWQLFVVVYLFELFIDFIIIFSCLGMKWMENWSWAEQASYAMLLVSGCTCVHTWVCVCIQGTALITFCCHISYTIPSLSEFLM